MDFFIVFFSLVESKTFKDNIPLKAENNILFPNVLPPRELLAKS